MKLVFKRKQKETNLVAYASGNLRSISEVPDEIFSKKMMGDGVAIIAKDTTVFAPCDGVVTLIAKTQHAVAIQTKEEIQFLIHIGLDSALHEEGVFDVLVKEGDTVSAGTPLVTIAPKYFSIVEELWIPLVVVENPNNKEVLFAGDADAIQGKESFIGKYE